MDTTEITLVSTASLGGCIVLGMIYYYVKNYCICKKEIRPVETIVVWQ